MTKKKEEKERMQPLICVITCISLENMLSTQPKIYINIRHRSHVVEFNLHKVLEEVKLINSDINQRKGGYCLKRDARKLLVVMRMFYTLIKVVAT